VATSIIDLQIQDALQGDVEMLMEIVAQASNIEPNLKSTWILEDAAESLAGFG
jgi:hypothetical protein